MIETLNSFKNIGPGDAHHLARYYAGFAKTRKYPRFYMAPLWLGTKGEFIHGIVNGCLCVVKRRVMYKNPVIYLILPPMHQDGDLKAEMAVVRRFQERGIGARLSEEDVTLYGLSGDVAVDKGNSEYIYRAGDYLDLSGKQNSNWRHQWNELATKCNVKSLQRNVPRSTITGCTAVDVLWRAVRGLSTTHASKLVQSFDEFAKAVPACLHVIETASVTRAYSMSQQILPGWVGILLRQHDFAGAISDYSRAQHLLDTRYWASETGPDTLLNIGAGVGVPGLDSAKTKLRPVRVMPIYKLSGDIPLTMEDYHNSKRKPEKTGFGFK